MTTPAEDIATFLDTQGVGTIGTDIFCSFMPDTSDAPDECIAVLDTGATFVSPKWQRDEVTVQVLVRGPERDYSTGYATAKSVQDALLGVQPQTINSKSYVLFVMNGGINSLGYDDQMRPAFSLNFRVIFENVSGGVRDPF